MRASLTLRQSHLRNPYHDLVEGSLEAKVKVKEGVDCDVERRRPIYRHFIFCTIIFNKGSKNTMNRKDLRLGNSAAPFGGRIIGRPCSTNDLKDWDRGSLHSTIVIKEPYIHKGTLTRHNSHYGYLHLERSQ